MNDFCALVAYKEPTAGAYFRRRNLIEVVNNWLRNFPEADIVVTEQIRSGTVEQAEARWAGYAEKFVDAGTVSHIMVECDYDSFHKTRILNEAIQKFPNYKFYILADADAFLDMAAFDYIRDHRDENNLVFPYAEVFYLDESDTRSVIGGKPMRPGVKNHGVVISRQTGLCNVFSGELYRAVRGFDEEFINWGAEDDAFCFKVKRLGRQVIRNNTGRGAVMHLFHPKVNTPEYVKSLDYRENRKLCACIRKMTDEDWERYLRGDEDLGGLARGYSDRGALVTHIEWPCVSGMFLTIDTTIYDVLADGETVDSLTFTKLMDVVRQEDGPEVAVQFLDNILMPLNPKTPEQLAELNGIRERLVKLAKEARGEA